MFFRYYEWDGSQNIEPLDPEQLLDLLGRDLLEDGDLRRALERLLMRGQNRNDGQRTPGMRDMLERLRQRREEQLSRYNLGSMMDDIADRLQEVIDQEQRGIDRLREQGNDPNVDESMRRMAQQMAQRKQELLDRMPDDAAGQLRELMDYEFLDQEARENFQELVNELRQQMLGDQFKMMQQNLESLTKEDLEPMREMMRALNQLLAKHVRGGATEQDFREFMAEFGHFFPPNINSIEDLVDYLEEQAAQMASMLASMPEDMRRQMLETMQALLQDDDLQDDIMQMADLVEQITGRPLGRRFNFSGDEPLDVDKAAQIMRDLNSADELERQLREAIRNLDFDNIDEDLAQRLLGPDARDILNEMRHVTDMLEEAGLARRGRSRYAAHAQGHPRCWANARYETSSPSCDRTA